MNFEIINQGDNLESRFNGDPATFYVIKGDCTLSNSITIPTGSVLKFEGGRIINNQTNGLAVTLSGSRIIVDAPKTQIFGSGVKVTGIANDEISAHWFGAQGDGVNDDSAAINTALQCAGKSWVVLENNTYLIKSSIVLQNNQRLRCCGTIKYDGEAEAIRVAGSHVILDIDELKKANTTSFNNSSSGVLFNGTIGHCDVNVRQIYYFNKAINVTLSNEGDICNKRWLQYSRITWQFIQSKYGIYIDMYSKMDYSMTEVNSWINENQFNGGRLYCEYGVYVYKPENHYNLVTNKKVGIINGNVFNSIGFEGDVGDGIKITPITLHDAWHNNFNDLRISEGLVNIDAESSLGWINLTNCGYLNFTIKSLIPYKAVKAVGCNNIKLSAAFCDDNYGYIREYDKMYVVNENPAYNTLNMFETSSKENYKLLTRDFVPSDDFKNIRISFESFVGEPNNPNVISLVDLYVNETSTGAKTLCNKCNISVVDEEVLKIKMERNLFTYDANASKNFSITRFNFPFMMMCHVSPGSKIVLEKNNGKKIEITQDGLYFIRPVSPESSQYEICAYTQDQITMESTMEVIEFK
ncbi:MAG: hypothetical protein UH853_08065 [Muribaculaceae bacterium]|nr:hypothetical protein [Muribaculaceae bacterium]